MIDQSEMQWFPIPCLPNDCTASGRDQAELREMSAERGGGKPHKNQRCHRKLCQEESISLPAVLAVVCCSRASPPQQTEPTWAPRRSGGLPTFWARRERPPTHRRQGVGTPGQKTALGLVGLKTMSPLVVKPRAVLGGDGCASHSCQEEWQPLGCRTGEHSNQLFTGAA